MKTTQRKSATATLPPRGSEDPEAKQFGVPFQVKADSLDDEARTFTGLASTWEMDRGGDVIHRGAFKRTISHWKKAKKALPLLDSHSSYGSIRSVVGKAEAMTETEPGLEVEFSVIDGPDGDEIWRRIKGGYVDGLSIGYRAVKIEMPTEDEQRAGVWRHLKEVELREISLVVWPMNDNARVDAGSMKALARDVAALQEAAEHRDLSDEEKAELAELQKQIGALLDSKEADPGDTPPAADPSPDSGPDELKGLAPEDPERLALEVRVAGLRLRRLASRKRAVRHSAEIPLHSTEEAP